MQHTQYADPHHLGHHALLRALKYLPLVVIGLVAAYEHSPLLLAVLALAAGLGLALRDRVERLEHGPVTAVPPTAIRVGGDGGSFPGAEPQAVAPNANGTVVLDGGSLEHHAS